ncbi:hypothetical protein [Amycolatopsis saalfeldensis]|uniref:hypothetical protein n=1 Tax=Amycolatopsis saalfeldensis TaxID=394193 RepID=UPI0011605991|nr:hypothetical protein [Amycolatopsis saalfeldensis]
MTVTESPSLLFDQTITAASSIAKSGSQSSTTSELNSVRFEADIPVELVNVDDLENIGKDENEVTLEIRQDQTVIARIVFSGSTTNIFPEEDLQDAVSRGREEVISQAISNGDAVELVEECLDMKAHLSISLRNDPSKTGFHYIEQIEYLIEKLSVTGWHKFVSTIFQSAGVLIVSDLGDTVIRLPELEIRGAPDTPGRLRDLTELPVSKDGDVDLPSPSWISPISVQLIDDSTPESVERLVKILTGTSCCLAYAALADRVDSQADGLSITFSGSHIVSIADLVPEAHSNATAEMLLFDWAYSIGDTAKREAIQQAASWTLAEDGSLRGAATPIYRTARSLYDLSQRGAIAEALATRRTARSSAIGIALDSAKLAREIVTKSVERTVIQIGAAVGIVIANAKDLLSNSATAALLFILTLLMFLSWLVSYRLELASASGAIESVSIDLQEYRDSLSEDDIAAIRNMHTLAQAKMRIKSAKRTVAFLSVIFAAAFMLTSFYYATGRVLFVGPPITPPVPASTTKVMPASTNGLPSSSMQAPNRGSSVTGPATIIGRP